MDWKFYALGATGLVITFGALAVLVWTVTK